MSFSSREFRDALGNFATGVCVVTANPQGFKPFGMTVNSFASVSLEPALVLWSLQNSSDCKQAFDQANQFAVNILSSDQQALSGQYARRGDHDLLPEHYRLGRSGIPVLRGAIASFECDVWARYPGGDHLILVGQVKEMEVGNTDKPLLFSAGQYRQLR